MDAIPSLIYKNINSYSSASFSSLVIFSSAYLLSGFLSVSGFDVDNLSQYL